MKISRESFQGNSNIGLFVFATNKYCIVPNEASETLKKRLKEVLGVKIVQTNIAGTPLVGVFCVGYKNKLFVPKIAFEDEIEKLEKAGIKVTVIDSDLTALGNNIVMNENKILANTEFDKKSFKKIKMDVEFKEINKFPNVGSIITINSFGGVVHPDISPKELKFLEEYFELPFMRATVNLGSPFLKSGIVANDNGVIVGDQTRGMELTYIQQGLGVVKK